MNDKADNSVADVVDPGDDLLIQRHTISQEVTGMSQDQDHTVKKEEEEREGDDAKGHLAGGDFHSPDEQKQSSPSVDDHDTSITHKADNSVADVVDPGDDLLIQRHTISQEVTGMGQDQDHTVKKEEEREGDDAKGHLAGGDFHSPDEQTQSSPSVDDHNTSITRAIHSAEESPTSVHALDIFHTKNYIFAAFAVVLAFLVYWSMLYESPPMQKEFNLTHVFHQEMDKVQSSFPSQPSELWRRSRIHLRRHLQMTHPSEPVSLLLTSGRGAEKTLACLAQQLAAAFSTALNASVLDIDGASKTAQDPDQVKLDIDVALKEAFEGGKRSAVIHRFEELPPGATLIFYRYCDHENAVFKNVFLTFTVLLEELELPSTINLGLVEAIVQEYLKNKFISSDRTAMFNQMDVDKLSGLWSRISHVILPVAPEHTIEQQGCGK